MLEVVCGVAACMIALMVAASPGGGEPTVTTTFASAGIGCAPSPSATGQVFLGVNATEYEVIAARLAIASVPGVTIDQYVDRKGALVQVSCVFANSPELVHDTRPGDLPVSFAVTADLAVTDRAAHLQAIPNVEGVVTPERWTDWWTRFGETIRAARTAEAAR